MPCEWLGISSRFTPPIAQRQLGWAQAHPVTLVRSGLHNGWMDQIEVEVSCISNEQMLSPFLGKKQRANDELA